MEILQDDGCIAYATRGEKFGRNGGVVDGIGGCVQGFGPDVIRFLYIAEVSDQVFEDFPPC